MEKGLMKQINDKLESVIGNKNIFEYKFTNIHFYSNGSYVAREYFSIFKDAKWEVELSLPLINPCWESDQLNINEFLNQYTIALLEKSGIKRQGTVEPLEYYVQEVDVLPENRGAYNDCFAEFETAGNIILFKDKPKIGKSLFMKFYCNKLKQGRSIDKIWWVDFIGGATDISYFISSLYSYKFDKVSYIIVDNIECCGFYFCKKILDFLIDFVAKINGRHTHLKLIILQDIDNEYQNTSDCVKLCNNSLSYRLKEKSVLPNVKYSLYEVIKKNISKFINASVYQDDEKDNILKTFFISIIYFGQAGVNLKISASEDGYNSDKEKVLAIIKNISEIKLSTNGEVISYTNDICKSILVDFKNEFIDILKKFNKYELFDPLTDDYNKDILKCYYSYLNEKNLPVSMTDFHMILKNLHEDNVYIKDLDFILGKAKAANESTIERVENGDFFDNHLGAILFAMENLAVYSDKNYKSLNAWIKLREFIRDTYYVNDFDPQLPSVKFRKDKNDQIVHDFKIPKNEKFKQNCLESQIQLHNEVLHFINSSEEITCEKLSDDDVNLIMSSENLDDNLFNFYVSPVQIKHEETIDIDTFYRTYILAILFEAEVTAPKELIDEFRIKNLWKIITNHCSNCDDYCYFYPARIPWVTARMALAMTTYLNRFTRFSNILTDEDIEAEIEGFRTNLARYLLKSSIVFNYNDKTYRFWSAGTGFWNSTLETTIMCALTLKSLRYSDEFREAANQGINFIKLFKGKWFNEKIIADGIWAYQATFDEQNIYGQITDFKLMIKDLELFKNDGSIKNDKSLGNSHIAKTLTDLAKKFVDCQPDLFFNFGGAANDNATQLTDEQKNIPDNPLDISFNEIVEWIAERKTEGDFGVFVKNVIKDGNPLSYEISFVQPRTDKEIANLDNANNLLSKLWAFYNSKDTKIIHSEISALKELIVKKYNELRSGTNQNV